MKGITLFADVLSVLILLAMIMLMTLLVWSFIVLQQIEARIGIATPRTVELTIFYLPAKYDATLMAFLEYRVQGMPMKKLLEASAIQENTNVWIDGSTINVATESQNFLSPRIDKPYILKIVLPDKEIIIVENNQISSPSSRPTSVQESSAKLFLLNGEVATLKLLVQD